MGLGEKWGGEGLSGLGVRYSEESEGMGKIEFRVSVGEMPKFSNAGFERKEENGLSN